MKRNLFVLLSLLVIASVLTACGGAPATKIRKERQIQKRVLVRTVGCHDQFIRNRGESFCYALDQRSSKKGLERLIFSHTGRLTTSLNANREHLGYYKG